MRCRSPDFRSWGAFRTSARAHVFEPWTLRSPYQSLPYSRNVSVDPFDGFWSVAKRFWSCSTAWKSQFCLYRRVFGAACSVSRGPITVAAFRRAVDIIELLREALRRRRRPQGVPTLAEPPRLKPADGRRGPVRPRLGFPRGVCGPCARRGPRRLLLSARLLQRVPWAAFRGPNT